MATYTLNFFDLSYISTDDPDGFSDNGGYQFDWGVSTVTIAPGATETPVAVEDIDSYLDDDQDADQTLDGPATLNGTSYPDGTWVQSEYQMIVQDSLGNNYTLQFVSAGPDAASAYNIVGFVVQGAVPPFGEALTVMSTSDGASGSYAYSTSSPACFGRTSRIATTRGHIRAMDLRRGDVVLLADGNTARVELILASTSEAVTREGYPIRIRKDAFGPGLPKRDLILSGQHRVWVPQLGALVAARALTGLPRVGVMKSAARQELIHVVLKTHEVLLAEGLACESYWPGRMALAMLPAEARRRVRRLMGRALPAMPFMKVQEAIQRLTEAGLAAPVGRVSIGREQQRDVVMGVGIGHAEAQRDDIKEQRVGPGLTAGAQVVPGLKDQLVHPGFETFCGKDRVFAPAVFVGDHADQLGPGVAFNPVKRDGHSGGRQPRRGVEDVCREISLGHVGAAPSGSDVALIGRRHLRQKSMPRPPCATGERIARNGRHQPLPNARN